MNENNLIADIYRTFALEAITAALFTNAIYSFVPTPQFDKRIRIYFSIVKKCEDSFYPSSYSPFNI